MVQLSRRPLEKRIETEIFTSLFISLASVKTAREAEQFLTDLLTPTEKVMLAKRLAIATLLIKDYSVGQIREVLKVSATTVTTVANWLRVSGGGYRKVESDLEKNGRWTEIANFIDDWLRNLGYEVGRHPRVRRMMGA